MTHDILYIECIIVTYDSVTLGMNRTILVVENDIDLIQVYKEILESYEFDVQTALNGKEGVEKFKQTKRLIKMPM